MYNLRKLSLFAAIMIFSFSYASHAVDPVSEACGGKFAKIKDATNKVKDKFQLGAFFADLIPEGSDDQKVLQALNKVIGGVKKVFNFASGGFTLIGGNSTEAKVPETGEKCGSEMTLEKACDIALIVGSASGYIVNKLNANKQRDLAAVQPSEAVHEQHFAQANIYEVKTKTNKALMLLSLATTACYAGALTNAIANLADVESKSRIGWLTLKTIGTGAATAVFEKQRKLSAETAATSLRNANSILVDDEFCTPGTACYCSKVDNTSPEHNTHCVDSSIASLVNQSQTCDESSDNSLCKCQKEGNCFESFLTSRSQSFSAPLNLMSPKLKGVLSKIISGSSDEVSDQEIQSIRRDTAKKLQVASKKLEDLKIISPSSLKSLASTNSNDGLQKHSAPHNKVSKSAQRNVQAKAGRRLATTSRRTYKRSSPYTQEAYSIHSRLKAQRKGGVSIHNRSLQEIPRRTRKVKSSIFNQISNSYESEAKKKKVKFASLR